MFSAKTTRIAVLIVFLAAATTSGYYLVDFGIKYANGASAVDAAQANLHVEIVRTTARDGTPLKGLLMASNENWSRTDHSIPFVMVGHGMSGDFYECQKMQYTLARAGYVSLSVEFRGHASNPAPCTLGSEEPWDILAFMDWVETNVPCVDISQSGIWGHSMGGLYGTLAYIFESVAMGGRGRFKALATLSGPNNMTREVESLTNNPGALGELAFTGNITGKNPLTYISNHSLTNVLVIHGTADGTVNYQSSIDFLKILDPKELTDEPSSWPDIHFISCPNDPHVLNETMMIKEPVAWLDQKVLGKGTVPSDVFPQSPPIHIGGTRDSQESLLYAAIAAVIVIASLIYLVKPNAFRTKVVEQKAAQVESNGLRVQDGAPALPWNGPTWLREHRLPKLVGLYFLMQFAAGVIAWVTPGYIVSQLGISAIATFVLVLLMMKWNKPAGADIFIKVVNPNATIAWVVSIAGGMSLYFLIPAIPALEDATLAVGPRITWWVPFITAVLALHLVTVILFARIALFEKRIKVGAWFKEMLVCGLLFGSGFFVFAFWTWDTILTMPFLGGITLYVIPVISLIFCVGFAIVDLITHLLEFVTKTAVTGAIMLGLAVSIFVGASSLILFY